LQSRLVGNDDILAWHKVEGVQEDAHCSIELDEDPVDAARRYGIAVGCYGLRGQDRDTVDPRANDIIKDGPA
jgi:hypothetical protein